MSVNMLFQHGYGFEVCHLLVSILFITDMPLSFSFSPIICQSTSKHYLGASMLKSWEFIPSIIPIISLGVRDCFETLLNEITPTMMVYKSHAMSI